jgi:manganese/zinc/iron transport system permease protein
MDFIWLPLDTWIVVIAGLTALACAIPGLFLLLRRQAMLGDAISHAVLPGIAFGYLLSGDMNPVVMLTAAISVGILTALLVQLVHRLGSVEEGAAMGVVFTSLFALGLVMVRRAADGVHLDAEHVIYGAIELAPARLVTVLGMELPRGFVVALGMLVVNLVFVGCMYKELRITVFDPGFADAAGLHPGLVHHVLVALTAATMVVAFESVGSILVLAMLIVPPATARLLTRRLLPMLFITLVFAVMTAALGHLAAITVPKLFGFEDSSTSGMIAVVAGVGFLLALIFAPGNGLVPRKVHQFRMAIAAQGEDVLGAIYRARELTRRDDTGVDRAHLEELFGGGSLHLRLALSRLRRRGRIERHGEVYTLTAAGHAIARGLVRRHRLWETWLVDQLGVRPDHVHSSARRLEQVTTGEMAEQLALETAGHATDPHAKEIPPGDGGEVR